LELAYYNAKKKKRDRMAAREKEIGIEGELEIDPMSEVDRILRKLEEELPGKATANNNSDSMDVDEYF